MQDPEQEGLEINWNLVGDIFKGRWTKMFEKINHSQKAFHLTVNRDVTWVFEVKETFFESRHYQRFIDLIGSMIASVTEGSRATLAIMPANSEKIDFSVFETFASRKPAGGFEKLMCGLQPIRSGERKFLHLVLSPARLYLQHQWFAARPARVWQDFAERAEAVQGLRALRAGNLTRQIGLNYLALHSVLYGRRQINVFQLKSA